MTVPSIHAVLPAAAPTAAGASQDAAPSGSGFAQALAQHQAHSQGKKDTPERPTDASPTAATGKPVAQDGEASASTPASTSAAPAKANPTAVDKTRKPTDSEAREIDPALAASMQLADFVRDLTTASRAVAARSQRTDASALAEDAQAVDVKALPAATDARGATSAGLAATEAEPGLTAQAPAFVRQIATPAALGQPAPLAKAPAQIPAELPTESKANVSAAAIDVPAEARPSIPGLPTVDGLAARPAAAGPAPARAGAALSPAALVQATATSTSVLSIATLPAASARAAEVMATDEPIALDPSTLRADTATLAAAAGTSAGNTVASMPPALSSLAPAPGAALPGGMPEPVVGAPFGSPQWAPSLGRQMVMLGSAEGGTIRHAELRLDPPDLGPLRISLNLSGDQATAVFVSAHPAVRAAVEAALPQLQQALADAGIQLGNASVGDHSAWQQAQQSGDGEGRTGMGDENGDGVEALASAEPVTIRPAPRGLVDTFA